MYNSDKRELLIRNSRTISELSGECEFRSGRGEDAAALRNRIAELASRQENLTDTLFGVGTLRYGVLHRTVFSLEEDL